MKQLQFALENEEKPHSNLPIPAEREIKLIELMAQAIVAVLQQPQGEADEPA